MRYFTEQPEDYTRLYGRVYKCNHPVYTRCTLYLDRRKEIGLAVIQQRYDKKMTYWTEIDMWLNDVLYLHPNFYKQFLKYAGPSVKGIYPTMTVRQLMWRMKMKPLKRMEWETTFDHCPI